MFNGGGVGGVDGVLGLADEVFEAAEKQDLEATGLGDRGHTGIVTRVA
jgi:hypothetical protein